jgi:hypothetical protein
MQHRGVAADEVEETWRRYCGQLDDLARDLRGPAKPPSAEVLEGAKARLLLCALAPRQARRLRGSVKHRRRREREVPWWRLLADEGRTSLPAAALALILAPEARFAAAQAAPEPSVAARERERGTLTPLAQGLWLRTHLVVGVPALLVALVGLASEFADRIVWFVAATGGPEGTAYPFTVGQIRAVADFGPQVVVVAAVFLAAQVAGLQLRSRRISAVSARAYVTVSAIAQGAIALAALALGALATLLGYVALVHEDKGFPKDFVPGWCKALVIAGAIVLAALYGLVVSVRRLALGLLGGQVVR